VAGAFALWWLQGAAGGTGLPGRAFALTDELWREAFMERVATGAGQQAVPLMLLGGDGPQACWDSTLTTLSILFRHGIPTFCISPGDTLRCLARAPTVT